MPSADSPSSGPRSPAAKTAKTSATGVRNHGPSNCSVALLASTGTPRFDVWPAPAHATTADHAATYAIEQIIDDLVVTGARRRLVVDCDPTIDRVEAITRSGVHLTAIKATMGGADQLEAQITGRVPVGRRSTVVVRHASAVRMPAMLRTAPNSASLILADIRPKNRRPRNADLFMNACRIALRTDGYLALIHPQDSQQERLADLQDAARRAGLTLSLHLVVLTKQLAGARFAMTAAGAGRPRRVHLDIFFYRHQVPGQPTAGPSSNPRSSPGSGPRSSSGSVPVRSARQRRRSRVAAEVTL